MANDGPEEFLKWLTTPKRRFPDLANMEGVTILWADAGVGMNKLQSAVIGLVLSALGTAAFLQILEADHVLRLLSIAALGTISILAGMVFFVIAAKEEPISKPSKPSKNSQL